MISLCSSLTLIGILSIHQFFLSTTNGGLAGSTFQHYKKWAGYQLTTLLDLNADRQMDLLFTDENGKNLYAVILPGAKSVGPFGIQSSTNNDIPPMTTVLSHKFNDPIRNVASADFNGDSRDDLLITTSRMLNGPFTSYISYGLGGVDRGKFGPAKLLNDFIALPLVCDLNADMKADVYGEAINHDRVVHYGGEQMKNQSSLYNGPAWSNLGFSVFGDVNKDKIPDILVLVNDGNVLKVQIIYQSQSIVGNLPDTSSASYLTLPAGQTVFGLFTVADYVGDGNLELLYATCASSSCYESSSLYVYSFAQRGHLPVQLHWSMSNDRGYEAVKWSWCSLSDNPGNRFLSLSHVPGSAVSDLNLDGLPDLGICLVSWSQSGVKISEHSGLLLNMGVNENGKLTFGVHILNGVDFSSNRKLRQMTFFDHSQDSISDVAIVSMDQSGKSFTDMFLHSLEGDPYFLKVTVLNGLCAQSTTCSDGHLPYGLVVPGVSASLNTETPVGTRQLSTALLGVQGLGASQVSFYTFGLGEFANYVENLQISIPSTSKVLRSRSFTFLPPKAQIMINPYPLDNPDKWTSTLFLKPLKDMRVVYIAIALVCMCIVLLILIIILGLLEMRQDQAEKQLELQRL